MGIQRAVVSEMREILSSQTFVQTKWMRGKAAAFCFQPFWVFTSSASSDGPHERNTENPKDPCVWSCNALDKPTVHADREAHCLPAFEGSFYWDIFSDLPKLWNFYLSGIIMKFLDSNFSFSHVSELGKALHSGYLSLLQQAWLKSHNPQPPSMNTLRRLSWILTHVRLDFDSAANLCLFLAQHKEGLIEQGFGQHGFNIPSFSQSVFTGLSILKSLDEVINILQLILP